MCGNDRSLFSQLILILWHCKTNISPVAMIYLASSFCLCMRYKRFIRTTGDLSVCICNVQSGLLNAEFKVTSSNWNALAAFLSVEELYSIFSVQYFYLKSVGIHLNLYLCRSAHKADLKQAEKKVLVLGAGYVARPAIEYLSRDEKTVVSIGTLSFTFTLVSQWQDCCVNW
jgi:FlaA1/EpsC-like NDP-sugar epimerase